MSLATPPPAGAATARWESQRLLARSVQIVVFLLPLAAGFATASVISRLLEPRPSTMGTVVWWVVVIGSATVASHFTEKATRRLAPLPTLLRLTMVFPDRAPSRFRMALRTRDSVLLRRQLEVATRTGHTDVAKATEVILSLAQALSKHDRNTRGHSERTGAYADLIAKEMGLRADERDKLRWAAVLHDIGKLAIPAAILNRPGPLTPAEYEVVKSHPEGGMAIIKPIVEWLGPFADGIGQHHERWDGTGYPLGLAGTDISLAARIISVADAYDVMTTGRLYQARVSHVAARREIAENSGTQFDPRVARALLGLSVGRLRWVSGPVAALADPRLLRPLEIIGRDVATVIAAGAITVAVGASVVNEVRFGQLPGLESGPTVAAGAAGGSASRVSDSSPGGSPDAGGGPPIAMGTTSQTVMSTTTTNTTVPTTTTTRPTPNTTTPSTTAPPTTTTLAVTTTTTSPSAVTAFNDAAATRPSDKVNIAVVANDTGAIPIATLTVVRNPDHGTVRITGTGRIRYDAGDFVGIDSFEYQVCNTAGACGTATVTVTVAD